MTEIDEDSVYHAPVVHGRMLPEAATALVDDFIREHFDFGGSEHLSLIGVGVSHSIDPYDTYRSDVIAGFNFVVMDGEDIRQYPLDEFARRAPDLPRLKEFCFDFTVALLELPHLAAGNEFYYQDHLKAEDRQLYHQYLHCLGYDLAYSDYMGGQLYGINEDEVLLLAGDDVPFNHKIAYFSVRVPPATSAHAEVEVQKVLAEKHSVIERLFWQLLDRDPLDVDYSFGSFHFEKS